MSTTAVATRPGLIATADTGDGWAIGIVAKTAFSTGATYFEVVRMNRRSQYVAISCHGAESDARARANVEFRADVAATR